MSHESRAQRGHTRRRRHQWQLALSTVRPSRLRHLGSLALVPLVLWCLAAIALTGGSGSVGPVRIAGMLAFLGATVWAIRRNKNPRVEVLANCLFVGLGFALVAPSNDRDWNPDQAVLTEVDIQGPVVSLTNIRDFRYRSVDDYDVRYYDATFDTRDIVRAWMGVVRFGPELVGHTLVSFEFTDDRFVSVSVEIRKETGESFSAVRGLFKQYELMYVVGDERDLVQLRTNHRKDPFYLHPMAAGPERTAEFFLELMGRVHELETQPAWYNTLTASCSTTLAGHLAKVNPELDLDWRIATPGVSDALAYELGMIATDVDYEATRKANHINARAEAAANADDFSLAIRR